MANVESPSPNAPDASALPVWKFALIGIGAGVVLGTLGVGGGVVIVPLLTLWLGVHRISAVAASLATIAVFSPLLVAGDALFHPERLQVGVALTMTLGAFAGVTLGTRLAARVPDLLFTLLFLALLLAGAAKQSGLIGGASEWQLFPSESDLSFAMNPDALLFAGIIFASGALGGLGASILGIGGGVVYVTCMTLMHSDLADPKVARATSLIIVSLTAIYASVLNQRRGRIPWRYVRVLIPGGLLGAVAGHFIVDRVSREVLGSLLAAFLLLNAARMTLKLVTSRRKPASTRTLELEP